MRLAIVCRSRDIFSVVPRNVLAAAAGAAAARLGRGLRWWCSGCLLSSLSLLLRGLGCGQDVLLTDPATYPGPVERGKVDAVLLGKFPHQRCHVAGVSVTPYRCRGGGSRGRRSVLFRPGVLLRGSFRNFGLPLRLWSGFGLRCWLGLWLCTLGLRLWLRLGLGSWLRLRRRRCRGSGFPDDRKDCSNFDRLVFLNAYLQQCAGGR